MYNSIISGAGHFVPKNVVTNQDIVEVMDTTVEFIENRTGVFTRRHVKSKEGLKDLIIPAFKMALKNAKLEASDIDLILVNTISPDHHDPSEACFVQPLLGLDKIPAFDIKAQCSGLIYGFDIADQYIKTGKYKNILIICGEVLSKRMDTSNEGRNLSILLGDGAGAVIVSRGEDETGFTDIQTGADGSFYKLLWTEAPGSSQERYMMSDGVHDFRMIGKQMFDHASDTITRIAIEILEKNNLTLNDIDVIIPHQPNLRILEKVAENLSISIDKMEVNVPYLGNIASASLPVTLSIALESGRIKKGNTCLFLAYGSGATWGAAIYKN
jgi:3-oxoacyl-(acyl-carrier-protein) synthase III